MTERKKAYFKTRTVAEIRDLKLTEINRAKGLVERINDLRKDEALIIRTRILPNRFFRKEKGIEVTGKRASAKAYRHGDLMALSQPKTQNGAYNSPFIPLDFRAYDFSELSEKYRNGKLHEEDIQFVGYYWRPVQGRDRTKRVVNFVDVARALAKLTYAENHSKFLEDRIEKYGIRVRAFVDAAKVKTEGGQAYFEVPSTTEKKLRYKFKLLHLPIKPNSPSDDINYNLAIVLSLRPSAIRLGDEENEEDEPVQGKTPHALFSEIQYKYADERQESDVVRFTPEEIAAYVGFFEHQMEHHNITPLHFNPFTLLSKLGTRFSVKCDNNVLIYDPTLDSKDKLRNLHLAEKSILMGRAIVILGHDEFAYWDPTRDGNFKDYSWSLAQ